MAKITNYDYNRTENSLTVTYESGTVRKYSVDCTPKSTQTFIMTDIINNILSEYKQKFLDRKEEIFPRIRYNYECHQFDPELSLENSNLCSNLNYISEFSSLSLVSFVSTLSCYYLALKDDALSKELPEYCSPYQHERLKSDYNFLSELVERFRIPADDCSFVFTLEHLLSVAFPDREYDAPETEDTTSEQSNNTPATEDDTPAVPAPVEKTEKPDDVPETALIKSVSIDMTEYKCSLCKVYEVSVSYKSGVKRSYTADSYEKIPCTIRTFIEINKSSENTSSISDDTCLFHLSRDYHEVVSDYELTLEQIDDASETTSCTDNECVSEDETTTSETALFKKKTISVFGRCRLEKIFFNYLSDRKDLITKVKADLKECLKDMVMSYTRYKNLECLKVGVYDEKNDTYIDFVLRVRNVLKRFVSIEEFNSDFLKFYNPVGGICKKSACYTKDFYPLSGEPKLLCYFFGKCKPETVTFEYFCYPETTNIAESEFVLAEDDELPF